VSEASDFATVIFDACKAPRAFLLPPPLRGRVGEGDNREARTRRPSPPAPPRKGEGSTSRAIFAA